MAEDRGLILHTTVGIGYGAPRHSGSDPARGGRPHAGIMGDRQAFVLTTALGDLRDI